jgi:hypothetical protein
VIPCTLAVTGKVVPEYDQIEVEDSKETNEVKFLKLTLQNNTIIVTDASVHGEKAAFSWVIADSMGEATHQRN